MGSCTVGSNKGKRTDLGLHLRERIFLVAGGRHEALPRYGQDVDPHK
jgi:hypothetical protein